VANAADFPIAKKKANASTRLGIGVLHQQKNCKKPLRWAFKSREPFKHARTGGTEDRVALLEPGMRIDQRMNPGSANVDTFGFLQLSGQQDCGLRPGGSG
jgi:hypothetical protein